MKQKIYYKTAGTVFAIVALMHLLRIFREWDAVIGGVIIPMWFSYFAVILAGYLAVRGLSLARR